MLIRVVFPGLIAEFHLETIRWAGISFQDNVKNNQLECGVVRYPLEDKIS